MAGEPVGCLDGLRVLEFGDEQGEYCGLVLAGLGAEVIKIEPPGGARSRSMAPFLDDQPDPEKSLFFWNYNRGKRSVVLDIGTEADRERLRGLLSGADVFLQSGRPGELAEWGLAPEPLMRDFPSLVVARITPFGDDGPWAEYAASDLVHLALGGVMDNCGYDPDPSGVYDVAPIAPQFWHAYHIAGDQLAAGIVAALVYRLRTGRGQYVSCAVHEAVSKNTELDVPSWIMRRLRFGRQTCQHAAEIAYRIPVIAATKDGRWIMTRWSDDPALRKFLETYGMAGDLEKFDAPPPEAGAPQSLGRAIPGITIDGSLSDAQLHRMGIVSRFVGAYTYDKFPWRAAQKAGLMFAPLRKPHENALDEHWLARETFTDIEHPDIGRSVRYPTSRWISTARPWVGRRRAPHLGEDGAQILDKAPSTPSGKARVRSRAEGLHEDRLSARGKPFALDGVRIVDFSWFLASAGGTRILSAYGAEAIKVEWKANPDTRFGAQAPVGGRAARDAATGPLPGVLDPAMGGQFNNKNPGKRGVSLNVRHPKGLELARRLIEKSDIVAEGFSPGVMDRWGLGYEALKMLRPGIIYAQQSGMGQHGTYGRFKAVGPIAQAFTGLCEMSGLPEPALPAGWGYSYLDWAGAYSFATAILMALYHRELTGDGQWIDASQCESGVFLCGVPILDWSANGRVWTRSGNRSPYQAAAPHGAYPCRGVDRWLAVTCFTEGEWQAFATAAGRPQWLADPRFADLDARTAHQDELDTEIATWSREMDAFEAMELLQRANVPAGVSQTAQDRCDHDPQLRSLDWMTEITGTKIGTWPVAELPIKMSATPPYIGGRLDRGAPGYGEDNEYVFGEMLGLSTTEIKELAEDDVI